MVVIVCCMYGIIRISFLRFTYAYIIYLFYAIVKPKRCGFHPTRKHVGFRRKFITPCHWLRYLHPPMVTVFPPSSTVTAISFFFVSVVMMALAELVPLSRLPSSVPDITWMPATILWIGICIPMTPVEATKTALAGIFMMSAAASAVALQYPYPSTPVQALAIPALMMTAWADGAWYTISWFHLTGDCLYEIGGKGSSRIAWHFTVDHRHIFPLLIHRILRQ